MIASCSFSKASNTVNSFVIDNRSWMRLVRFRIFSPPTLAVDGVQGADHLPETGAVDVRDLREVEHQLLVALKDHAVDLVLQKLVAFPDGQLARQVQNHHVADLPLFDLHRCYTPASRSPTHGRLTPVWWPLLPGGLLTAPKDPET